MEDLRTTINLDAAPTTSDPMRQFEEGKEREAAKLMNKIANSKFYTIYEYRDIEASVRRLAGLPRRDYQVMDFKKDEEPQ